MIPSNTKVLGTREAPQSAACRPASVPFPASGQARAKATGEVKRESIAAQLSSVLDLAGDEKDGARRSTLLRGETFGKVLKNTPDF